MKYPILKIKRLKSQTAIPDFCFVEDLLIYSSDGLFGFITNDFRTIIPPTYNEIFPAFTSHFWGRKNKKWKLYNFKNIEIYQIEFEEVSTFQNGFACVSKNGKTFGFINRDGDYQIPAHYLKGQHLGNALFAVGKNIRGKVKYGIIDNQENPILPFIFNDIPTFTEVVLLLLNRRKPLREWLRM